MNCLLPLLADFAEVVSDDGLRKKKLEEMLQTHLLESFQEQLQQNLTWTEENIQDWLYTYLSALFDFSRFEEPIDISRLYHRDPALMKNVDSS